MTPRIAYLGPPGTYSHEAALLRHPAGWDLVPLTDIPATIEAVTGGAVDEAMVPVENSTEGVVTVSADALIAASCPPMVGEVILPIRHCLLAAAGSRLEDVVRVFSLPQPAAQCRVWLATHLPGVRVIDSPSSAAAVRDCLGAPGSAAIASRVAARLYGAAMLATDIQDRFNNATRFAILGHTTPAATGTDRTSLVVTLAHVPGSLASCLEPFARRQVNLIYIGSRPTKEILGEYIILLDFEGHITEERVAAACDELRERCFDLRILGSYPRWPEAAQ